MHNLRFRRIAVSTVVVLSTVSLCVWSGQAAAQIVGPPTDAQSPPSGSLAATVILSPEVLTAIAPVENAIARTKLDQAKLPPPASDRETLLRMRDLDQAAWQALSHIDFARIPADQKAAAKAAIGAQIEPVDQANQDELLKILPPEGWFAISRYGADGEEAAYLVVLHSDIALWRRFAPVVGRFAAIGEANGAHYALMADRLAVHEDRPQSFGSQVQCVDGVYKPYEIEAPENLDDRRLRLGLVPYAAFLKTFEGRSC